MKNKIFTISLILIMLLSASLVSAGWFGDFWSEITGRAVSENSLVAYYKFENNAQDSSGNGNNGVNHGASFVDGKVGKALSFDGDDDYVDLGYLHPPASPYPEGTISVWAKRVGQNPTHQWQQYIVTKDTSRPFLGYFNENDIRWNLYTGSAHQFVLCSKTSSFWEDWHHIVGVWGNTGMRLYVDGALCNSNSYTGTYQATEAVDAKWYIGARGFRPDVAVNGLIDEVKIWNYALSASAVLNEYNSVPIETPKCTDSDGGKDYYVKGIAKLGEEHEDSCGSVLNRVNELYCGNILHKNDYVFVTELGKDKRLRYKGSELCNSNNPIAKFDNVETGQRIEVSISENTISTLNIFGKSINFKVLDCGAQDSDIQLLNEVFLIEEAAYVCRNGCKNGACVKEQNLYGYLIGGTIAGFRLKFTDKKYSASTGLTTIHGQYSGTTIVDVWVSFPVNNLETDGLKKLNINDNVVYFKEYPDMQGTEKVYKWLNSNVRFSINTWGGGADIDILPIVKAYLEKFPSTLTDQLKCVDSDGGKNYHIKGTARLADSPYSSDDYCSGNRLAEAYCNEAGGTSYHYYMCPNGCKDGACLTEENYCGNGVCAGSETYYNCREDCPVLDIRSNCRDLDGGIDYYESGDLQIYGRDGVAYTVHEKCVDSIMLEELYCNYWPSHNISYKCPNGCQNGVCIKETQTCTDSDGGENIYEKGQVIDIQNGVKHINEDECILYYDVPEPDGEFAKAVYQCSGNNCKIMEQICIRDNTAASQKEVACPQGCQNGACIEKPTCTDSDGGKNIYVKGIVTASNFPSSLPSLSDACIGTTQVAEYYCDGSLGEREQIECPYGCKDGACLKVEISPTNETGPIPIPENITKESEERSFTCYGCILDNKCYPFGYRKEGKYCSDDNKLVDQFEADSFCENNFECKSNLCIGGKCVSSGLWQRIINWFKNLLGG